MEKLTPTYVLDLGIGHGGDYILKDRPSVIRVGMDLDQKALQSCRAKYGIAVCRAIPYNNATPFPFENDIFTKIEIFFPHDALLYSLTQPDLPLWPELYRILKPGGKVRIVVDEPGEHRTRQIYVDGQIVYVIYPDRVVEAAAQKAGFLTHTRDLQATALDNMGTYYSRRSARYLKRAKNVAVPPRFPLITAIKP